MVLWCSPNSGACCAALPSAFEDIKERSDIHFGVPGALEIHFLNVTPYVPQPRISITKLHNAVLGCWFPQCSAADWNIG